MTIWLGTNTLTQWWKRLTSPEPNSSSRTSTDVSWMTAAQLWLLSLDRWSILAHRLLINVQYRTTMIQPHWHIYTWISHTQVTAYHAATKLWNLQTLSALSRPTIDAVIHSLLSPLLADCQSAAGDPAGDLAGDLLANAYGEPLVVCPAGYYI